MFYRGSIAASLLTAAFVATMTEVFAFDETKYPDLRGEWRRGPLSPAAARARGAVYDPSKGWGPAQQAPLTPEYQVRFEVNLADQAAGGQGIGPAQERITIGPGVGHTHGVAVLENHGGSDGRSRRQHRQRPSHGRTGGIAGEIGRAHV